MCMVRNVGVCVLQGDKHMHPVQNYIPELRSSIWKVENNLHVIIHYATPRLTVNSDNQTSGCVPYTWNWQVLLLSLAAFSPPTHLPQWTLIFPSVTYKYVCM
ncbi:unnamed protein product [Rangifer tarandus platyrhynchus]|uniref:Uncharacterized protein n=2 Tax=Rangifer tarandus platyrhynchus TaxID=3082113 RepID=A0ABN8XJB9_RANTA|nr:unnamed protein product [Rangifer tarandus platyrhynchus]CAI9149615.1 unnamed protein product [Rangifer tarandus platyrhynchus]CAI9158810.1 unnamed protein product [Rangifer tarandus platyrhynchus]